jgi:serine/threonine protein phosphatase PrpC
MAWIHAEDRSQGRRLSQRVNLASGALLLVIADGIGGAQVGELADCALALVGSATGWLYYRGKSP